VGRLFFAPLKDSLETLAGIEMVQQWKPHNRYRLCRTLGTQEGLVVASKMITGDCLGGHNSIECRFLTTHFDAW